MRTIAISFKEITGKEDKETKDSKGIRNIEKTDMILFGICGIEDPLRDGVPEAVARCIYK